jgi:hypothetical protein
MSSDRIRLNVGGKIFETKLDTLENVRFGLLFDVAQMNWTQRGDIFIDRDPTYFRYILNFLREKKIRRKEDLHHSISLFLDETIAQESRSALIKEFEYFGLY